MKRLLLVFTLGVAASIFLFLATISLLSSCVYTNNKAVTDLIGESMQKALTVSSKWESLAELLGQQSNLVNFESTFQESSRVFADTYNQHIFFVDYSGDEWSVVYKYPSDSSMVVDDLTQYADVERVIDIVIWTGESYIMTFPRTETVENQPDLLYCTPVKFNGSVVSFLVVGVDTAALISSETPVLTFLNQFHISLALDSFDSTVVVYTSKPDGFEPYYEYHAELFHDFEMSVFFSQPRVRDDWFAYVLLAIGLSISACATLFCYMFEKKGQSTNQKTQFLARMSHEIRTPMNGIIGMTDVLSEEDGIPDKALECIRIINRCSKHLLHLVNNILDLSKIQSKKIEVHAQLFTTSLFSTIVHDTWLMSNCNTETTMNVVYENVPTDAEVLGDTLKIQQVISNLVTNAVKFTNKGSVSVRICWGDRNSAETPGSIVVSIHVIDTGIGIPENSMQMLFKPYTQMSNNNLGQGTGIGLTISRSLAVAMGGSLTCKSKEAEGSEFIFRFIVVGRFCESEKETVIHFSPPLAKHDRGRITSNPSNSEASASQVLALVVDDNDVNIQVMQRILYKLGVQSHTTHRGEQAIAMCKRHEYDVIFMDKFMPGMDGIVSTREIRRGGLNAETIIFFCTADVSSECRTECRLAGGTECLPKPVTSAEVRDLMTKHGVIEAL